MLKHHKKHILITTLITIFPILIGLLLWNQLPDQMATHWGADGAPNGWSSKPFAVIGLPLVLVAIHWFCIIATAADPRSKNHSGKMLLLVLWICPLTSLFCMATVYAEALGHPIPVNNFGALFCGLLFIIIGNYMPKCAQNYTIGIKIPWTLNSAENWNRTHRMAGPVYIIGGILFIILTLMEQSMLAVILLMLLIVIPVIYSYWYYRTHERD